MAEYRHSAHAVFDLKYHLIWRTKYRYKILRGRVAERARDLILAEECAKIIRKYRPDAVMAPDPGGE